MPIRSARRYFLLKAQAEESQADPDLGGVWRSRQQDEPGTALPETFPHRARLVARGYSTHEDLDGADPKELVRQAGLSQREAREVLTALEALLPP